MNRQDLIREAFKSYDRYMNFEHKSRFQFFHKEAFAEFEDKVSKNGEPIRSVSKSWIEDLGLCEEIVVAGSFRGTMIDNLVLGIEKSLESGGLLFDKFVVSPGLMKSTKIDCVRVDKTPPFPSTMTDCQLEETWCSLGWTPFSSP